MTLVACQKTETTGNVIDTVAERRTVPPTYRASGRAAAGDVFVHLFDWRWDDIARECELVLAPAGYKAVQISPPNEHSITPNFDWSERYQPVSYALTRSRSGTRDEFVAMVARCKAAGVDIYVDAVINHMTNFPSPGVGSAGTAYSKYNYPGLYTQGDFHVPCGITNYQNAANVQDCELLSLPDLHTGLPSVRQKIADYLIALHRLGVAGYRIDAAKHIQQWELDQIAALVNSAATAEGRTAPYWFLEVIGGNGEALKPSDYYGIGYSSGGVADITEFTFVGVGNKFRGINGERIAQLNPNGGPGNTFSASAWGMMPSDKAVVFLQNHDTQHDCGIGYKNGMVFRLANVWMLATPYGYPTVLSSFAFNCPTGNSMGPPSDAAGWTTNVKCAADMAAAVVGEWVCEHRDPYIRNMIRFRKVVAGTDVTQWWDNGNNAIAFSRGNKGFVAINREGTSVLVSTATGLPAGTYCDVISGG
ncbi:MAG TPA: alpha-amylase family protein, partial [Gemmatimonadaceae bacterium]|nr:alpha-amylase family protein [Gemmatimonadaceae bacterium]